MSDNLSRELIERLAEGAIMQRISDDDIRKEIKKIPEPDKPNKYQGFPFEEYCRLSRKDDEEYESQRIKLYNRMRKQKYRNEITTDLSKYPSDGFKNLDLLKAVEKIYFDEIRKTIKQDFPTVAKEYIGHAENFYEIKRLLNDAKNEIGKMGIDFEARNYARIKHIKSSLYKIVLDDLLSHTTEKFSIYNTKIPSIEKISDTFKNIKKELNKDEISYEEQAVIEKTLKYLRYLKKFKEKYPDFHQRFYHHK